MFLINVVVYLCIHSADSLFDESSDTNAYDYDHSKGSYENLLFSKEDVKNGNLNSTIETSVCKYQETKNHAETNEYKNTLIEYPYVASIQRQGSHYTSGALVDKRWVLSSANEFYKVRESIKLFRVRLGSVNCKRGGTILPIISIEIHPSFARDNPGFDISLLKLGVPVTFSLVVAPIPLSNVEARVLSARFMTTYWPRVIINKKVLPLSAKERYKFTNMRVSTQELIPFRRCSVSVKNLTSSNLCLRPIVTHHSVCIPDAGSPVVAKDGLWGITSGWVSPRCPSQPAPTVFTRVSITSVRLWIDSVLLP